jgi:hypothetical protein
MPTVSTSAGPSEHRWDEHEREQHAELDARAHTLTVAERLDRGLRLSRIAVELRRAAREALHGHPAV